MPFTRFNPRQKAISQKVIIYFKYLKTHSTKSP